MKIFQSTKCWLEAGSPVISPRDDFGGNRGISVQDIYLASTQM